MASLARSPRPTLFDGDRQYLSPVRARPLPSGPCSLQVATLDGTVQCCCKQFWLKEATIRPGQADTSSTTEAWCFCGHHACFHEHKNATSLATTQTQELGAEPFSNLQLGRNATLPPPIPSVETTTQQTTAFPKEHYGAVASGKRQIRGLIGTGLSASRNQLQCSTMAEGRRLTAAKEARQHLPGTQEPSPAETRTAMPPPAWDCWVPPKTLIFGLVAGSPSIRHSNHHSPRHLASKHIIDDEQATELATPSPTGTPAPASIEPRLRAHHSPTDQWRQNKAQTGPDVTAEILKRVTALESIHEPKTNLMSALPDIISRIEALEAASSFDHPPAQELHDRFEHFDGRMLDVEGRISDLEEAASAKGSVASDNSRRTPASGPSDTGYMARLDGISERLIENRRRLIDVEEAVDNVDNMVKGDHHQRLTKLETALNDVKTAVTDVTPSIKHPWIVEIVFIPFGRKLKGLWQDATNAASAGTSSAKLSGPTTQSATVSDVASGLQWKAHSDLPLVAQACAPCRGPTGLAYERLKSRGFVQTVSLKGNTTEHLSRAVMDAFSHFAPMNRIKILGGDHLHGLLCPFVPLRKVHKSRTLHFLTPAELATPSLWTAELFNATVFMRAPSTDLRRLFITEPEGYSQQVHARDEYSWPELRELARYRDGRSVPVAEADANEPCWKHDERLDAPVDVDSSSSSGSSSHQPCDPQYPLSPKQTDPATSDENSSDSEKHEAWELCNSPMRSCLSLLPSPSKASRGPLSPTEDVPSRKRARGYETEPGWIQDPPRFPNVSDWSFTSSSAGGNRTEQRSHRRSREPTSVRISGARLANPAIGRSGRSSQPQLAYATPASNELFSTVHAPVPKRVCRLLSDPDELAMHDVDGVGDDELMDFEMEEIDPGLRRSHAMIADAWHDLGCKNNDDDRVPGQDRDTPNGWEIPDHVEVDVEEGEWAGLGEDVDGKQHDAAHAGWEAVEEEDLLDLGPEAQVQDLLDTDSTNEEELRRLPTMDTKQVDRLRWTDKMCKSGTRRRRIC